MPKKFKTCLTEKIKQFCLELNQKKIKIIFKKASLTYLSC
ncbi:hypothetical protein QE380_002942 [Acinetobacter baylyi]|uniref:Transposase n=1 Tax=Acinetobacter baylyi TaxID=202950 RepID=A0ABU0UZM4_ACIBI|nr:hypothetical protein F952_02544 [Acinetobacter baylyi DSM 14961 = CIP 107474]MDQ1210019.1 hypothetical protein [Acinetobacter baylyi]MDR6106386.1 hypothetical protein [Acinetobacter baylyi]MDR6186888.1 hypothetical protein [Acinetobacter baylyi]